MKVVPYIVPLTEAVARSVDAGLVGAALVDRDGYTITLAGAISAEEAMPLAALGMHRLELDDVASRLFAGEVLMLEQEDRFVAVGIAKKTLFVVAIIAASNPERQNLACLLRDEVAELLPDPTGGYVENVPWATSGSSGSGSGSGPAELELVEYGITVGRERAKA